jgi:hypothetical protein
VRGAGPDTHKDGNALQVEEARELGLAHLGTVTGKQTRHRLHHLLVLRRSDHAQHLLLQLLHVDLLTLFHTVAALLDH